MMNLAEENIAIVEEVQKREEEVAEKNKTHKPQKNKKDNKKGSKYEHFINLAEEQFANIQKFYGLDEEIKNLLYVRENADMRKKVILVSEGVRKFLEADKFGKLKLVNMGTQAF